MFHTALRKSAPILNAWSGRVCMRKASTVAPTIDLPTFNDFKVKNEPVYSYDVGSKEREDLKKSLKSLEDETNIDIPIVIGGEEIRIGQKRHQVLPFQHEKKLAKFYWATSSVVERAIEASLKARPEWEKVSPNEKAQIFLKAADLVSGKYRMKLNAATMLGQAKTFIQAEIDSAAELADFFRFNALFYKNLHEYQPISENPKEILNRFRHRGLEGFVAAVAPFNFTAIGGNLTASPVIMGNVVLWKPSDTAVLSNYLVFKVLEEAGIPPGVINFVPSDGPVFGNTITASPYLSGINFTGSVGTFRRLWKQVGENISLYYQFPRLSGECGGKNFHFIHPSADVETVINCTTLAAFEFSGQKCSACSRLYVPKSLWAKIKAGLLERRSQIKLGSPLDFDSFTSAVIDRNAFNRISSYIKHAQHSSNLTVLAGGKCDDSVGYFIEPTIVETKDPNDRIMKEEIFGPIVTAFVYDDKDVNGVFELVYNSTPFSLTGAIFSLDRDFLKVAAEKLKLAAGNFYINDKCTAAVVGQQPFGGGRLSGTNDKPGGPYNLLKWTSPQSVKERFTPVNTWIYPSLKP